MISTQHYRLPVRRYILDLFTIELTPEVVRSLTEHSKSLRAPASFKPLDQAPNRFSIFGRLGRQRRPSESDEDEGELDVIEEESVPTAQEHPAINLRPVNVVAGFSA
jgi:rapamycin-insensitive companion of mTOR